MARMIVNATVGTTPQPRYGAAKEPNAAVTAAQTLATTADTDAGTVVTNLATTLTDLDAFAAAVIAITGDTYVSHQFVFGGATGLTHAQVATTFALLNTAITAHLASQTAAATAKADTAATLVSVTAALATVSADVSLLVNAATVLTKNKFKQIIDALYRLVADGSDLLA